MAAAETSLDDRDTSLVLARTRLAAVPYVPEMRLHLADEVYGLWERTGRLPFWAFAWAGGLALARHVLDHPEVVRDRTVLDLASGSGVVAIAAALAGAAAVTAGEVDPLAAAAIGLNAAANEVTVTVMLADLLGGDGGCADVVLAGDVFYEEPMADRVLPFLERARARGAQVLVGDPGRAYLPDGRFTAVAVHSVPTLRVLEDAEVKRVTIWRV
ncbi:MAG: methyltransferase [Actinomycetia bacterium]|jgi:predicted nicotinamide N-methyase|nr:methyltransferase [Actinomycetes bacterium]